MLQIFNGALSEYELSKEQFERARVSYKKYEKSGIINIYNKFCIKRDRKPPSKVAHYAAGTLELTPIVAEQALIAMELLKGKYTKNSDMEKIYTVYHVSQLVIDNINRDPELTEEEKKQKIRELESVEYEKVSKNVEEANRMQGTDKYKIAKEDEEREIC